MGNRDKHPVGQQSGHLPAVSARKNGRTIRETRLRKGMQGAELAKRLGVSPARVSVLERDEVRGAVTMRMMERVAQALDCEFVYSLVPRRPVQKSRDKRKVRLDSDYNVRTREQQLYDLARQLEDMPEA